MKYLTVKEILAVHFEIIEATGGRPGVRDIKLLESIVERPKAGVDGQEFYRDVFGKAAAYIEVLINYYVFIDGNKRTGAVATARFLFLNGYRLTASNDELESFVLRIARKEVGLAEISAWLKKNTKKIERGGNGQGNRR